MTIRNELIGREPGSPAWTFFQSTAGVKLTSRASVICLGKMTCLTDGEEETLMGLFRAKVLAFLRLTWVLRAEFSITLLLA